MLCFSSLGKTVMNTKKLRTPAEVVQKTRSLLLYSKINSLDVGSQMGELNSLIRELKLILYGDDDSEPSAEACAQLTVEFFKEDTLRLLIIFLPKLNLEARKDATQVVASLQRQPLPSRFEVSRYLEANLDLLDILISGYEDPQLALHYGRMLKECLRHQIVASYLLEPIQLEKLFGYIQHPSFDIAADAADAFKDLLTRHKSTVSESLSKNYSWVDIPYLFVANENKPPEIVSILVTNRSKILRLLSAFAYTDDEVFETDKIQVINKLAVLELQD
ncbi:hypothetical protein M8C21_003679 [Ambrosia artemisiifolia]|uniref:MO25-like protein At5g47540 n=1 Tax=Ambrosia artemisiifolia TaxID=4212 RepID=A0AAD5DCL8_AMBAR|nr:hypothetical protein M8C21_003679 [Ambrosia artemisiifolia]